MKPDHAPDSWEARDLCSVLHGFTDTASLTDLGPVVMTHGEGLYVFDVHGKAYMDANAGLWNMVAGFNHPRLIEAGCEQLRRFPGYHAFFGRISDKAVELSEKLLEISPFPAGRVFFTNSGSEANDSVVKMLWLINRHRGRPQARKIISRVNAYHGVTAVTASMTAKPYNNAFGLPLPGFLHTDCPHYWRYARRGESEAAFTRRVAANLEALIIREGADTIAGFFAEPVMGAGGVITPSDGYFAAVQPILHKYGIPLVADEVICGFGRTGEVWGSQTYAIEPEVIVASKAITAGYFPMGAIILSEAVADALQEASAAVEEFPHGFTTGAHPVGCAVALEAIDLIVQGGLLDNVRSVSTRFQERLREFERFDFIGEARGVGLMGALEMVQDKSGKTAFPGDLCVSEKVANAALRNGLICRPLGQAVVLCPPFIITPTEIDELFTTLEATLTDVFDNL